MKKPLTVKQIASFAALGVGLVVSGVVIVDSMQEPDAVKQKPALTVTLTKPQAVEWPISLSANGSITAWQEAIVGTELSGLRLAEVLVNVGDIVQRGQLLARFVDETVAAEVGQQKAAVEEARAALFEAKSNAERARTLRDSGALSGQQINQYVAAERTAQARFIAAHARLQTEQIRLEQTRVLAPDDGAISSRTATVGAVAQQGQELFKLIRNGRLEWRAEVTSNDLSQIKPGQSVKLVAANGARVAGKVRMIGPTIDPQTRNAIVYVDLPGNGDVRAGMFATGEFELGRSTAVAVPQMAVVMRDGFSFVYVLGRDNKIAQTKVNVGRRVKDQVEVVSGLDASTSIVEQGAGFLSDGDTVRVVDAKAPAVPLPEAAKK
jgi:RND family efflux transporter MFP subunit